MCDISLKTDILNIDYQAASINDRCISHENLRYIKKAINLDNISIFPEKTEIIFDIYPIDMFMMMDVFKYDNETLWIELKMPVGIFTNGKTTGYFIAFNFWSSLFDFRVLVNDFIKECEKFI